jgi:hypothetical protein
MSVQRLGTELPLVTITLWLQSAGVAALIACSPNAGPPDEGDGTAGTVQRDAADRRIRAARGKTAVSGNRPSMQRVPTKVPTVPCGGFLHLAAM